MGGRIDSFSKGVTSCLRVANPRNWDKHPKKVAAVAFAILATCIVAMIVSSLMVKYPGASGAFFTLFGVGGVGSIIVLAITLGKHRKLFSFRVGKKEFSMALPQTELKSTPSETKEEKKED